MALDMIAAVEEAENEAAKIRSKAKLEAANIVAQAEADGKASIKEAVERAADQSALMAADLDKRADDDIEGIVAETGKIQRDLRVSADAHMDEAVNLIKERIIAG